MRTVLTFSILFALGFIRAIKAERSLEEDVVLLNSRLETLQTMFNNNMAIQESINNEVELNKLMDSAESCSQIAKQGWTSSSEFLVDPDGRYEGFAPIKAWCEFPDGGTYVGDDQKIKAEKCGSPDCFKYQTNYHDAPLEQLKALIETSDHCYQNIKFDCTMAPLKFDGESYFKWFDVNGDSHELDAADDSICNLKIPEERYDTFNLTESSLLPITAMSYGIIRYELEELLITIGPLKCQAKPEEKGYFGRQFHDLDAKVQNISELFKSEDIQLENKIEELVTNASIEAANIQSLRKQFDEMELENSENNERYADVIMELEKTMKRIHDCPMDDTKYAVIDDKCIYFEEMEMNFSDAQANCESKNGRLFEPRNENLMTKVFIEVTEVFNGTNDLLIGVCNMDSNGLSDFVYASSESPLKLIQWGHEQPSNPKQDCVFMSRADDGKWHDGPCNSSFKSVCEILNPREELDEIRDEKVAMINARMHNFSELSKSEDLSLDNKIKNLQEEMQKVSTNADKIQGLDIEFEEMKDKTTEVEKKILQLSPIEEIKQELQNKVQSLGQQFEEMKKETSKYNKENIEAIKELKQELHEASTKTDKIQNLVQEFEEWKKEISKNNKGNIEALKDLEKTVKKNHECPENDPKYFVIDGICLYYEESALSFADAQNNCNRKNGRLYEPRNDDLAKKVYDGMEEAFQSKFNAYIGIRDFKAQGASNFLYAKSKSPLKFTNWGKSQPNSPQEECVLMSNADEGKWHDYPCNSAFKSVCEIFDARQELEEVRSEIASLRKLDDQKSTSSNSIMLFDGDDY